MPSLNADLGPGAEALRSLFQTRYAADTGTTNEGMAPVAGPKLEFRDAAPIIQAVSHPVRARSDGHQMSRCSIIRSPVW